MGGMITTQSSRAIETAARSAAFVHWFGIERRCAELLCVLYTAKGSPLTLQQLAVMCNATGPSVRLRVHLLRRAMEVEAIDRDDAGYWLTDTGLSEARDAMGAMARSLAA